MEAKQHPYDMEKSNILPKKNQKLIEYNEKLISRIRQICKDEFDPVFIEQMNTDRSLVDKKKMETDFYTMTAKVIEELDAITEKS